MISHFIYTDISIKGTIKFLSVVIPPSIYQNLTLWQTWFWGIVVNLYQNPCEGVNRWLNKGTSNQETPKQDIHLECSKVAVTILKYRLLQWLCLEKSDQYLENYINVVAVIPLKTQTWQVNRSIFMNSHGLIF